MTRKDPIKDFDFDQWVRLAQEDPDRFEEIRQKKIDGIIESVPEEFRNRIRGLQWQIDQMRQTAKNPMASCIKITTMMWDTVLGDDGLVKSIENLGKPRKTGGQKEPRQAKIIELGKSREAE